MSSPDAKPPFELHRLAARLADRIWVGPKGELAIDAAALESVSQELIELGGKSPEFFLGYRHVMEMAFALAKRHPDSPTPLVILRVLDEVAKQVLPKLGAEDLKASQEMLDQVGTKFREFTQQAEGDPLPDTGERLDKSKIKSDIKG